MKNLWPNHLTQISPWPVLFSLHSGNVAISIITMMVFQNWYLFCVGAMFSGLLIVIWGRDCSRESLCMGKHLGLVQAGLKFGMVTFIVSEILFFSSFFWGYFHLSLSASPELGSWPPSFITLANPFKVPLLNTIILLGSGVSITWAHHVWLLSRFTESIWGLTLTSGLGFYFLLFQVIEYLEMEFTISDSGFGSIFFLTTGFHGVHVILGSFMLLASLFKMKMFHYSSLNLSYFEMTAWYWHFVDVVWLVLFTWFYFWIW